jgi:hypothetical protein
MHENKMLRVEEDLFDWTKSPGGPILQPERRQLDDPNGAVFDFRLLGTVFSSPTAFHSYDFGDHLASGVGTVRAEVERVELNSRELQLITTDYPTGSVLRQWIDIERGPSIVQAELEGDSPSRHYLDRVVSRLQNYAGVWFPDQVVFTRFVDRRPVGSSYVTTLHKAEFNTGLKDDLFTLGALGVPAGTNVKEFPPFPEGQRIWDGEKLVVKSRKKRQYVNLKVPLKANGGWRSILLWTNALAGAGCLALFTYRTIRRRQTSS